ncbi:MULTISPECIES: hypothetical protein [Haloferax]|uniref:Uncharacterized protein n=2 Tax=Haloferax TaxID=2251 RepID=A0A6G1Z5P5_9EURY|nr:MULTISPECIES: hypothetical protein [Haloferax]KAB1185321.1 hypothetical protein Hfx1149_14770 [Haloferax sp. CBA1149]MRW81957.1 hypothetical protein [Haloferax marinisediminis]
MPHLERLFQRLHNNRSPLRERDDRDDETEERLDAALWQSNGRVATHIDAKLDEFIRQTQR